MKKKVILSIIIIAVIIIGIVVVINFTKSKKADSKLTEIAEFYDCEFIKKTPSMENGYSYNIYWKFGYSTIENGESNANYYESVLKDIAGEELKNFIVIDEENDLKIKVVFNEDKNKINYLINDDANYFQDQLNKLALDNRKEEVSAINLNIKSNELLAAIQNNWSRKKAESYFGTKVKTEDGYDYYSNGIKVRTVGGKIYNLVFEKEYGNEIFDEITANMDNADVAGVLGNPPYTNNEAFLLIGYKTDSYYVFFRNGEVSIYRIENNDEEKSKSLGKLIDEYTNDKTKYKEIIKEITTLYPEYDSYSQDENGVDITYHLLGFEVKIGNDTKSGFYFYSNYNGYVSENLKIDEIGTQELKNIYIEDEDYILEQEQNILYDED